MSRRPSTLLWQLGLPVMLVQAAVIIGFGWHAYTYMRSAAPDPASRAKIAEAAPVLGGAAIISIVLTLAAVVIITRRLSTRMRSIAHGAARFAEGDLSDPVQRGGPRELDQLAEALNRMAGQLQQRFAQLQLQQRQQRAILQSMSNAVLAVDSEQRISLVNRAAEELLGLRSQAVHRRLLQEVIRQPELNGFVRRALSDPTPQETELRLHGDPPIVVQATSGPLTTADGAPAGLLLVLNDVSELRRLEALRSDFAANVSHELRTPITNLKGYIETLIEVGVSDESQARRFLKIIQHNIERLAAIVDDVLALTEFERPRSKGALERLSTPVAELVDNVLEQFGPSAEAKGIALRCCIPETLEIPVQPRLIEQAIGNLVSNAITYSPSQTTVTIEARSRDDQNVEIAVADQGPGIAAEHLPRLFERFYRVDKARSSERGGTGLGLAIVKHIALSHGGTVDVTSELGAGSRFVIILPHG